MWRCGELQGSSAPADRWTVKAVHGLGLARPCPAQLWLVGPAGAAASIACPGCLASCTATVTGGDLPQRSHARHAMLQPACDHSGGLQHQCSVTHVVRAAAASPRCALCWPHKGAASSHFCGHLAWSRQSAGKNLRLCASPGLLAQMTSGHLPKWAAFRNHARSEERALALGYWRVTPPAGSCNASSMHPPSRAPTCAGLYTRPHGEEVHVEMQARPALERPLVGLHSASYAWLGPVIKSFALHSGDWPDPNWLLQRAAMTGMLAHIAVGRLSCTNGLALYMPTHASVAPDLQLL